MSAIARYTAPAPDEVARALTWVTDEKALLVLAAVGWIASHSRGETRRPAGNNARLVAVAASLRARHEVAIRQDPAGPKGTYRARARRLVLRKAQGTRFPRTTRSTWVR